MVRLYANHVTGCYEFTVSPTDDQASSVRNTKYAGLEFTIYSSLLNNVYFYYLFVLPIFMFNLMLYNIENNYFHIIRIYLL